MLTSVHGRLERVVSYVHAHPSEALDLEALARRCAFSKYHFQRWFKDLTGRTPRQFVEQSRCNRAAQDLIFHDRSILDIGLDCGFNNAETFSRAFRRCLGVSPSAFRDRGRLLAQDPLPDRSVISSDAGHYELSPTRVAFLRPQIIAAHRHRGDYESMGVELWADLVADLTQRGLQVGRFMGIGWDLPSDHARFDAAATVAEEFEPTDRLRRVQIPAGPYAVTSHVGPYQTLTDAMMQIVTAATRLDGYQLVGAPVVEVYHTEEMDQTRTVNMTDIYMLLREETNPPSVE